MEMHQIRYFLAVARTLNFTRGAEECNVAQPSLTRAIKKLEHELGGELFRRERANSHLTQLGQSMLPILTQCYDSAIAARQQADLLKKGVVAPLRVALSRTIDFDLIAASLVALNNAFGTIQLSCPRARADEILPQLRAGDADIALAGPFEDSWDRLDSWPLFTETHWLVMHKEHRLANSREVTPDDLKGETVVVRAYCEQWERTCELLGENHVDTAQIQNVSCDRDAVRLLETGMAIAFLPASVRIGDQLRRVSYVTPLQRTVRLYSVAGRQRSPALAGFLKLLRSADWSRFEMGPTAA